MNDPKRVVTIHFQLPGDMSQRLEYDILLCPPIPRVGELIAPVWEKWTEADTKRLGGQFRVASVEHYFADHPAAGHLISIRCEAARQPIVNN